MILKKTVEEDNLQVKTAEFETSIERHVCEHAKLAEELYNTKIELTKQYESLRSKNKEIDKLRKAKAEHAKKVSEDSINIVCISCKAVNNEAEKEIGALNLGKQIVKTVTAQNEPKCEPCEENLYSDLKFKEKAKDDSNNNQYKCDYGVSNPEHSEIVTGRGQINPSHGSTLCFHIPQCHLRDPRPPPPFLPLNWVEHSEYYEPRPPPNIRLLPNEVENVQIFHSLSTDHQCEDCDSGSIFEHHHETVYYPDPGPCD